jgi:hypothetical protein
MAVMVLSSQLRPTSLASPPPLPMLVDRQQPARSHRVATF